MWTRAELKQRAKANLKHYFLAAFIVSMIFELISGGSNSSSGSAGAGVNINTGISQEYQVELPYNIEGALENVPESGKYLIDSLMSALGSMNPLVWGILAGAVIVTVIISLALGVFVTPVMEIGRNRFYMESRGIGTSAGIARLFWGFNRSYLNIVWTMFLKNLIVTLGTFCCIVPGIYLSYCYYMVPFILAENPDMKAEDVLRLSKDMMEGQKFNTFVLELSFWGWWFLGSLTFGIGTFFVQPYYDATLAELYAVLRQKFSYILNGFGYQDYGPSGGYDGYQGNGGYYNGYGQNGYYNGPYGDAGQYQNEQYQNAGYGPYGWTENDGGNMGWQQPDYEQPANQGEKTDPVTEPPKEERNIDVKRSEGGPGRGYYLNGVFHPYTEDELDELDKK